MNPGAEVSTDQESRPGRGPRQSPAEFEALYAALRRRATGAGGSPARISPACVRAAAGEIRSGRTVRSRPPSRPGPPRTTPSPPPTG
ncbi:conserved hypothetical protein [Streptomyces sp. Mg1]|nr:conserved hypothetical protein [Streptomyces sp. Mg1]